MGCGQIGWLVPRAVAAGLIVAFAVVVLAASVRVTMEDVQAYWQAALRLRAGQPLYPPVTDIYAADVYRYAPWFAWAWVPLTFLPIELVTLVWGGVLLGAGAFLLAPLVAERQWLAATFFAPLILDSALGGNVHVLMLAGLVWGVERRSGPLWIALAASLKAVPIMLCLVYVGRRQWDRLAWTLLLTALLVVPAFLNDLSAYSRDPGDVVLTWGTPLYVPLVVGGGLATLWLARAGRAQGWLAAGTTAVLALPRVWPYDFTFVLVGLAVGRHRPRTRADQGGERAARSAGT